MTEKEEMTMTFENNYLNTLNVLPYRTGFEEQDREIIQQRLADGMLKGIISTSALELGLDIPFLDVAILMGASQSSTSFLAKNRKDVNNIS